MDGGPELVPVGSFDWVRWIDRIDFDSAAVVQKLSKKHRPAQRTIAGIACRVAFFADGDTGKGVRPSVARLSVACRVDQKTVGTVLAILRDLWLLDRIVHGNHRRASEYRLTVPVDLHERVKVLNPDEFEARVDASSRQRADSNGGMHATAEPAATGGYTDDSQSATGGCPPEHEGDLSDGNGGMPAPEPAATGGCPSSNRGMHTPHQPETNQLTTPTKTSPEVSSSPARASPSEVDAHPHADKIAALRTATVRRAAS